MYSSAAGLAVGAYLGVRRPGSRWAEGLEVGILQEAFGRRMAVVGPAEGVDMMTGGDAFRIVVGSAVAGTLKIPAMPHSLAWL